MNRSLRWSLGTVIVVAGVVQGMAMVAVDLLSVYLPVGVGAILAYSGLAGGVIAGVLLSRFPVGYDWRSGAYLYLDAALGGVGVNAIGVVGYFAVRSAETLIVIERTRGFWAPMIVGGNYLWYFAGYLIIGSFLGPLGGAIGFFAGNAAYASRRASPADADGRR